MKLSNYYHPTPKKWRKMGDAFLATGLFITTAGMLDYNQLKEIFGEEGLRAIMGTALVCGFLGKFITNLFKEDGQENNSNTTPS